MWFPYRIVPILHRGSLKKRYDAGITLRPQFSTIAKPVPPYLKRARFVPRKDEDFRDGGAFPEIHIAQYPLDMGREKGAKPGSKILPVTVHAHGNLAYDAIVKQNENAKKIVYSQKALKGRTKEQELRAKARSERTGTVAPSTAVPMSSDISAMDTDSRMDYEPVRERERESERDMPKELKIEREEQLQRENTGDVMYDQGLFNQEKGMDSGFATSMNNSRWLNNSFKTDLVTRLLRLSMNRIHFSRCEVLLETTLDIAAADPGTPAGALGTPEVAPGAMTFQ
ncbi:hypothetical protein F3Y22_tig00111881pilonHSYRG00023 [Hibiscus syriacus]|uniref:Uncharacterized protein n=1 Tax=Hibiscus syriacus TaxID=106335 RepID=A0A6A2YB45_HIBSY|nr:hypothetical protein F3Y22_tig00111881pilonHSYRG00023 [Hibiscus syriacus]